MQVTKIIAAAFLSVAAVGAMAQELDHDRSTFVSQRSRAAVEAEAQNARAQGPSQWASGGELRDAAPVSTIHAPAVALTRQEVKAQVAAARAAHQLPRNGEIG